MYCSSVVGKRSAVDCRRKVLLSIVAGRSYGYDLSGMRYIAVLQDEFVTFVDRRAGSISSRRSTRYLSVI